MIQLVLASQSPRRSQLLTEAGLRFTVDSVKVSEIIDENLNLERALIQLARTKGEALLGSDKYLKLRDYLVISADTVVIWDGQILGKPQSPEEAVDFLHRLSGKTHCVKTAFALQSPDPSFYPWMEVVTTLVQFHQLTTDAIDAYVATGSPMDKAGAYGIQDPLVKAFVKSIRGSTSNVVGLPLERVVPVLKWMGIK